MPVLIKREHSDEGRWMTMEPAAYGRESELQELLREGSPDLIPIDTSSGDRHVVYAREVSTGSGPIDLVGIGSSGSITIMECKLARNRQIKREVVGQVLDYAASLWEVSSPALIAAFRTASGTDPYDALRLAHEADEGVFDEEQCRIEVARRLEEGDFRLLVAVDEIDADLRRIIQYVNRRGGLAGGSLKLAALTFPRFALGDAQVITAEAYGDELGEERSAPTNLTESQRLHLDYWTEFAGYLEQQGSQFRLSKPPSASVAAARTGTYDVTFRAWNRMNDGFSGVEGLPRTPEAIRRFDDLNREAAQAALGHIGSVSWPDDPSRRRIWITRDGRAEGMPTDRANWPALMAWMADALEELRVVLGSPAS